MLDDLHFSQGQRGPTAQPSGRRWVSITSPGDVTGAWRTLGLPERSPYRLSLVQRLTPGRISQNMGP